MIISTVVFWVIRRADIGLLLYINLSNHNINNYNLSIAHGGCSYQKYPLAYALHVADCLASFYDEKTV